MKHYLKLLSVVTFSIFLLLAVGCEQTTPVSPQNNYDADNHSNNTPNFLRVKDPALSKFFLQSKLITPMYGGQVVVGNFLHGFSTLTFTPGAVPVPTMVTFGYETEGLLMGDALFSPHGINFSSTVVLKLSYKMADLNGVDEEDLKIYYFNDENNIWEEQFSVVNTEDKTVLTFLQHFSRYGIAAS